MTQYTPQQRTEWDRFVQKSPQGILYCHTWWLDAVAPGRYELLAVRQDNEIRAGWPVVWAKAGRRSRCQMPNLTQKLGVLFAPPKGKYAERLSTEHRLIERLLTQLPAGAYIDQRFHENFTNWLAFHWHGFRQTSKYTYVLEDLTDLDALWAQMRHSTRKTIRRAQREQIRCRETEDLELFYEHNRKSFARQGLKTPYGLDYVRRIDEACVQHAGRRISIAETPGGRVHACDYLVYDSRCAISLMGGTDVELRRSGAKYLLEWEAIRFASTVSQRYDFEGSMMRPIEPVPRGFGGRQVPYFRIYGRHKPSRLRRLAGKVLRKLAEFIDYA